MTTRAQLPIPSRKPRPDVRFVSGGRGENTAPCLSGTLLDPPVPHPGQNVAGPLVPPRPVSARLKDGNLLSPATPSPEQRINVTQLFTEHYDGLYRYLVRLTGDSDLAADAAQEAFVRLVERPPQDRHVRAWLFAVATNVARDNARARARWATLLMGSPGRAPMGDVGPGPDGAAESAERRKVVRAALDRLSWKERTVLLMREEGFAHHEIADAVGTTTGLVGTMIARALNKLSNELAPTSESLK